MKTRLLSCALGFWLVAGFASARGGLPQAGEDAVSVQTERYELYAPSEKKLNTARKELEYALAQFRRYFGEVPPKIAVVVFDSPEKMQAYDFSSFRKKGLPVLPWMSAQYIQKGGRNVSVLADLGVVLRDAGPAERIKVATLLPTGSPPALELRVGDAIRSLNGKPVGSLGGFEEAYGQIAENAEIELGILRDGRERKFSFAKPAVKNAPQVQVQSVASSSADSALRRSEARPLSHEAGHLFLIAYVNAKLRVASEPKKPGAGHYGHERIPDWFDEAVATLCEFPALQKTRQEAMVRLVEKRIPFAELFTMEHPVAQALKDVIGTAREQRKSGEVRMEIITGGENLLPNPDRAIVFYAESLTLAQFLADKEGPAFIGQIAAGLLRGETMTQILRGPKSLPSDLQELEKAWVKWVAQ